MDHARATILSSRSCTSPSGDVPRCSPHSLGMCWFLAFELDLGLLGIWYGTSLDWIVRVLFLMAVYKRGSWKRIKL